MKKKRFWLLLFLLLLFICPTDEVNAQQKYYSKSKRAIKQFELALQQYRLSYFSTAKEALIKALDIDKKFIDAYILLGEIANEENQKEKAINYYLKAISIDKDYNSLMYLRLADLYKETGNYQMASSNYKIFLSYKKLIKSYGKYVHEKIKHCEFAVKLKKHPVKFSPENLGPNINTALSEYWPSLTADDSTLIFTTSDRKINSQEDLYFSIRKNRLWQKAKRITPPVNTSKSEGAQSISADGKTMVFTACLRQDGLGSCDLYIAKKKGKEWSIPVNMGAPINGKYKESQPSLSADGKTIYFASNRPGGKGKFDIWKSNFINNSWTTPTNLGDKINTDKDELAPFIHYDDKTLYFSSEGHLGMGGSDLFMSRKINEEQWGKVTNLGYPINTHFNEESLIVTSDGHLGLFSSNMEGGYGQKDIYQFELPSKIRPNKTLFIKGIVFNAKTKEPLHAQIDISFIDTFVLYNTYSDEITGEFLSCLSPKKKYAFNVEKKGFLIFSESIELPDSAIYIKIPLQPIEKGVTVILKNIFFEYDSYKLKKESFIELNKLKKFLKSNNVSIEIQGHTDNHGTALYNQKLSTNRAKAVYDFLIKSGIKQNKLSYKGYGFSIPIANNETDAGRAKNRRTQFKIIFVKKD